MFEESRAGDAKRYALKKGHEARFLERLNKESPVRKKGRFPWIKIAASVAIVLTVGLYFFTGKWDAVGETGPTVVDKDRGPDRANTLSLGDLSPDLRKVEQYYVANINLTLSQLEVSEENKAMVDGFMEQLSGLDSEYQELNTELNTIGPNDQTITALIKNLRLRLQLLQKLKTKLNELKSSENEQVETNTI